MKKGTVTALGLAAALGLGVVSDIDDEAVENIREAGAKIDYIADNLSEFDLPDDMGSIKGNFSTVSRYNDYIEEAAEETGVPADFIRSYLTVESAGSSIARSEAGAAGIAQFLEPTAEHAGLEVNSYIDERLDPRKAIPASAEFYDQLLDRYDSKALAAAAYNMGEDNTDHYIERYGDSWEDIHSHVPDQTRNYVVEVLGRERLLDAGTDYQQQSLFSEQTDIYTVSEGETASDIAEEYSVSTDSIRDLNPQIRDFSRLRVGEELYVPER